MLAFLIWMARQSIIHLIAPDLILLFSIRYLFFFLCFNIFKLIDPALDKHLDVRQQLSEYLHLEYADKHKKDGKYFKRESLQVIQPTLIPQQKGYIDCGLFLLHFAELFLVNPPTVKKII